MIILDRHGVIVEQIDVDRSALRRFLAGCRLWMTRAAFPRLMLLAAAAVATGNR